MVSLQVTKLKISNQPFTNCIYVSSTIVVSIDSIYKVETASKFIFVKLIKSEEYEPNQIGMNSPQREFLSVIFNDKVIITPASMITIVQLINSVTLEIDFISKTKERISLDQSEIILTNQVINLQCTLLKNIRDIGYKIIPVKIVPVFIEYGIINELTEIKFVSRSPLLKITGNAYQLDLFKSSFDLKELGIGGLSTEFEEIFRRAFQSRTYPSDYLKERGITHIKGILLFGPPGTGKTLIARKIGELLNTVPPKIVSGPELLNKYVGQSEENMRKLFEDAKSDPDNLHLIIFDEFDAICKERGSSGGGTSTQDNITNQFLTELDGVEEANNILVICTTNRKDIIDPAALRAGRLELHIRVQLPDETGRQEILEIHTRKLKTCKSLSDDVDILLIASKTEGYSGAEIKALVKAATDYAMRRNTIIDEGKVKHERLEILVTHNDFERAILHDVKPCFSKVSNKIKEIIDKSNFVIWCEELHEIYDNILSISRMLKDNRTYNIVLQGKPMSGKTLLATNIAINTEYTTVRLISPTDMLSMRNDYEKVQKIKSLFEEVYNTDKGLLIIDQFDRLLEWSNIGLRYNNAILQAILSLMKSVEKSPNNKAIIIFTLVQNILEPLEIIDNFDAKYDMPIEINNEKIKMLSSQLELSDGIENHMNDITDVYKKMKYL